MEEDDEETISRNKLKYLEASQYPYFHRLNQQFQIEHDVSKLQRSLQWVDKERLNQIQSLQDKEKRLRKLQNDLRNSIYGKRNNISKGSSASSVNVTCQQQASSSIPPKELQLSKPYPPRNVIVKNVGHDFIELSWVKPIMDGGTPIYDYEISYNEKSFGKKNEDNKQTKIRTTTVKYTLKCARWSLVNPIHQGFILRNLKPSTQYSDIQIRSLNKIGYSSQKSKPAKVMGGGKFTRVHTLDPIKPTAPLFFHVVDHGSTYIEFEWEEPFENGGVQIKEYILKYIEIVPRDTQVLGCGGDSNNNSSSHVGEKEEEVQRTITINATAQDFCVDYIADGCHVGHKNKYKYSLQNLYGGKLYREIQLCAKNESKLYSPCVFCEDVLTKEPTFYDTLLKEIDRVKFSHSKKSSSLSKRSEEDNIEYIDTDFFHRGMVQREEKQDYLMRLEKLKQELELELSKNPSSNQTNIEVKDAATENINANGGNKETSKGNITRKAQFNYRISTLKKFLIEKRSDVENIKSNRIYTTLQLKKAQTRILELTSELDRVSSLQRTKTKKNAAVWSDVIHHGRLMQKFSTPELLQKELHQELKEVNEWISQNKKNLIQGEKDSVRLQQEIRQTKARIQERKVALEMFIARVQEEEERGEGSVGSMGKDHDFENFITNADNLQERIKDDKKKGDDDDERFLKHHYFHVWKCFYKNRLIVKDTIRETTTFSSRERTGKNNETLIPSTKSSADTLLRQIEESTFDNLELNASVMNFVGNTIEKEQSALSNREEEDHLRDRMSFTDPNGIENRVRIRKQYDHNDDKRTRSHDESIQSTLNENQIKYKISTAIDSMNYLESRLLKGVNSDTVDLRPSKVIQLERIFIHVTPHLLKLRQDIQKLKDELWHLQNVELVEAESDLNEVTNQKKKCEEKLNEAVNSTDLTMNAEDFLLHTRKSKENSIFTNIIKFDTSYLIQKLKETIGVLSKDDLKEQMERVREIKTKIPNLRDDIKSVQEEIDLESRLLRTKNALKSGQQKLRTERGVKVLKEENDQRNELYYKSEMIRCIGFNASNTHYNDVTAAASTDYSDVSSSRTNISSTIKNKENVHRKVQPYICFTENNMVFVHHVTSGELRFSYKHDNNEDQITMASTSPTNKKSKIITCIYFYQHLIYTGSIDRTIMCWDMDKQENKFFTREQKHSASITCIHVDEYKMVTGSADKLIGIWNKDNGVLARLVQGHSRGILYIESGLDWCVSSGSDGDIFVWKSSIRSRIIEGGDSKSDLLSYSRSFKLKYRLKQSHEEDEEDESQKNNNYTPNRMITVARYGSLEVVSGDNKGFVSVWWLDTQTKILSRKTHQSKITDLQFDATKIVSSGLDGFVRVMDIMSGNILFSLGVGSEKMIASPILNVVFDSQNILCAAQDGVLRQWRWRTDDDDGDGDGDNSKMNSKSNNKSRKGRRSEPANNTKEAHPKKNEQISTSTKDIDIDKNLFPGSLRNRLKLSFPSSKAKAVGNINTNASATNTVPTSDKDFSIVSRIKNNILKGTSV